jgi:putative ABC transport system permease protein
MIDANNLLDKQIHVGGIGFKVIGILNPRGSIGWQNVDEQIWVPLLTAQSRLLGSNDLDMIKAQIDPDVSLSMAMVDIERVLRREHRIPPGKANDFTLGDPAEFLNVRRETNQVFAYLLAGIASVSLLVGGIGTMNIMLVTVTERTGEIGLRKALGATRSGILTQFLIEAIILCVLGGIGGVLLGMVAAGLMNKILGWQILLSPIAVVIAVGFSMAIGLFFGIWPARKAALLSPVDALRSE